MPSHDCTKEVRVKKVQTVEAVRGRQNAVNSNSNMEFTALVWAQTLSAPATAQVYLHRIIENWGFTQLLIDIKHVLEAYGVTGKCSHTNENRLTRDFLSD